MIVHLAAQTGFRADILSSRIQKKIPGLAK